MRFEKPVANKFSASCSVPEAPERPIVPLTLVGRILTVPVPMIEAGPPVIVRAFVTIFKLLLPTLKIAAVRIEPVKVVLATPIVTVP